MAAGPIIFADALVNTAWGNATSARGGSGDAAKEDRYFLTNGGAPTPSTGVCFDAFTLNLQGEGIDVTQFTSSPATAMARVAGLYRWSVELGGKWPRSAQKLGNSGALTFASGYAVNVTGWDLNIDVEMHEWIPLTGAAVNTPYNRPGRVSWGGSYTALVDAGTSLSHISTPGDAGAAITLNMYNDTADATWTGNVVITNMSTGPRKGSMTEVTYTFEGDGNLTAAASTSYPNVLPPRAVAPIDWDYSGGAADGIPDGTLTCTLASGKTVAGVAILSGLRISCRAAEVIAVTATAQGAGALAIA